MTCAHLLRLIDGAPFVDYPRASLTDAWQHASRCGTCGPALKAAEALRDSLAALPEPMPSPKFAITVLTRLAQTEQTPRARTAMTTPATERSSILREGFASAAALGGLAAGLAIVLSIVGGEEVRLSVTSPTVGGVGGLVAMPSTIRDALILGVGLTLYVAGLFAPLIGRERRQMQRA